MLRASSLPLAYALIKGVLEVREVNYISRRFSRHIWGRFIRMQGHRSVITIGVVFVFKLAPHHKYNTDDRYTHSRILL
jgi:hypothetical protein